MVEERTCLTGRVYAEIIHIGNTSYEHIGFIDDHGEFPDVLSKYVGRNIKICIEVVDDAREGIES